MPDRRPISDYLDTRLSDQLKRVPADKTVRATAAITNQGVEFGIGARRAVGKATMTGEGYAAREWGSPGWIYGARFGVTF